MDMKMIKSSEVLKMFINDKEFAKLKKKEEPKYLEPLVNLSDPGKNH
jgi:hypothetical protein